ncbi:alpha-L-rhamnosidase [Seonamhaeicola sp. ML3]|uniref:alpha-L-rhamnosidase n=1 Tax=Seonamhaeicola sp. ML3 TaxID=2937786 RepID=UPI00200EAFB8|nr:alpha-L-rhamnosidase [Seonamhaeicola sp. ML3]
MKRQSLFSKILFLFIFLVIVSCGEALIEKPIDLTISEGFENPIGFYNPKPTFSWQLSVSDKIKSQSAFQIVVASKEELLPNNPDLWDSKKEETSQSTFVKYQGQELQSRQKVFWQVRYWNQDNAISEWSEINSFELGLLNNSDWKAKWIGLNTAQDNIRGVRNFLMHRPQYLRKGFELKKDVKSARLYITAKGVFDVHLNGKDVSDDVMSPGWTPYNYRIETLTYDVTQLLKTGQNALAVELASGWHSSRISRAKALYKKYTSPKIICQLEITLQDGSKQTIISDESWKGTTNGPIRLANVYDGEFYDANYEMPNWKQSDFNDSTWNVVETEAVENSIKLEPKRHHSVKTKTILSNTKIVAVTDSTTIFNMQQNMVGVPKVSVPMKKGDTLKIRFSEMLLKDGTFYTTNYRTAKSSDFYVASKDGVIEYTPKFTFHGFQFVELSGYDKTAKPDASWVTGLVQHSNFEQKGTFTSSHQKLNQLQSNITWGLRGNFFDIPTDCPQRDERLGWTGDAQVIAPTSLFNYNVHSFWTAWLQSVRESQTEDGRIPWVVPDVLQIKKSSSGWGDAITMIPWEIYKATGDRTILEESYESAKKWVSYYESEIGETPFVPKNPSFGDWLQPFLSTGPKGRGGDTSRLLINTAFYAHSAQLISKMASLLGKTEDEKAYKALFENIAKAFEKEFFDENGIVKAKIETQTAYLVALYFDLLSPEIKEKVQERLLVTIKKADNHLRTGFLGTPILPKVLDDMGEIDLMYDILFKETYPSWFYSINQGATTMWERWNSYSIEEGYNPQPMNSLNHYAYGAIGQWMYERIAGLSSLEPGYKKIKIAPVPNTKYVTSASASLQTAYGEATSAWEIEKDSFTLQVVIPPNTNGTIKIPNGFTKSILINGEPLNGNYQNTSEGTVTIQVTSGSYIFQSKSN